MPLIYKDALQNDEDISAILAAFHLSTSPPRNTPVSMPTDITRNPVAPHSSKVVDSSKVIASGLRHHGTDTVVAQEAKRDPHLQGHPEITPVQSCPPASQQHRAPNGGLPGK
jgi:hypothetical protein